MRPTVNLKRAITRRDLVLQTMVGSGAITAAEADQARAQPVQLKSTLGRDDPHGAWFKEEVRRQLIARFGLDRVYQGGLQGLHDRGHGDAAGGRTAGRRRA